MIEFCTFDNQFKEYSFYWVNDEDTQKLILSTSITLEQQQAWFETLSTRDDYCIWGIKCEGKPIGAIGFKHINEEGPKAEYFGYIGEKEYRGKGIGRKMMDFAETKARELGLEEIYLNVSNSNLPAINLYKKVGFLLDFQREQVCCMSKRLCEQN